MPPRKPAAPKPPKPSEKSDSLTITRKNAER